MYFKAQNMKKDYPIHSRRNGGAKPKNMEVRRGRRFLDDSNGSRIETPVKR